MYNMVHEMIAIRTFQVVCSGFGYNWMQTDTRYSQNSAMVAKWYRHSVFFYFKCVVVLETKVPGSAAAHNEMSNRYRQRKAVSHIVICCQLN